MKITKRQLKKIIREEKRRMKECGEMDVTDEVIMTSPDETTLDAVVGTMAESGEPEGELVMEMEMASRNLDLALESIGTAAALCPTCIQEVAAAGPLMEALTSQAEALQETLSAVGTVISENAGLGVGVDMNDSLVSLGELDY